MFKKILISVLLVLFSLICIILFMYFENINEVRLNDIINDYYYLGEYPLNDSERVYSPAIVEVIKDNDTIINVIAQYPTGVGGALLRFNFPVINGIIDNTKLSEIYIVNAYTQDVYPVYYGVVSGDLGIRIINDEVETSEANLLGFYYKVDFNSTFGAFLSFWEINLSKKPVYDVDNFLQYVFVDYPNWIGNFFNIFIYFFRGL